MAVQAWKVESSYRLENENRPSILLRTARTATCAGARSRSPSHACAGAADPRANSPVLAPLIGQRVIRCPYPSLP